MRRKRYNRKILNNNHKSHRLNGHPKDRIGLELPITDKNGNKLHVGDYVRYGSSKYCGPYEGRIFWNYSKRWGELSIHGNYSVMLYYSRDPWMDEFDQDAYYKCITIPMDDGGKLDIEKIETKH